MLLDSSTSLFCRSQMPAGVACMLYRVIICTSDPSFKHAYSWRIHLRTTTLQSTLSSTVTAVCHWCAILHCTACAAAYKKHRHNCCLITSAANFSHYFFECCCSSACSCCEKLSLTLVSSQSASQSSALAGSSSSSRHSATRGTCLCSG